MTDFGKWDRVARESVAAVEAEAEREVAENDAALGISGAAASDEEAKDKDAHAQLKAMKKHWQERERAEEAAKWVIEAKKDDFLKLTADDFVAENKRVLVLSKCSRLTVELAEDLTLIKLFVEHCDDVTVTLKCRLVTSFVDVAHSKDVALISSSEEAELRTVQVDLSRGVQVTTTRSAAAAVVKVYHAGCTNLSVNGDVAVGPDALSEDPEDQFLSQFVESTLTTERLVKDPSRLVGVTERELKEQGSSSPRDEEKKAFFELEKSKGNECFTKREYAQSAAHYTFALADDHAASAEDRAVLLANRAAAFLKLGQPEKALKDASKAVDLRPSYAKAHFRKGLALHALQRYKDALPCLGTAHDIEPKNAQINDAIRFAEMRLHSGASSLRNPYKS